MRAVVQRVAEAAVTVDGATVGAIGPGLVVLLGVAHDDDETTAAALAGKVARLRIFEDAAGQMNRSVLDTGGAVLAVSQFTLLGDTRKGNRPSFIAAARPEVAEPLYERFVAALRELGIEVATGRFRTAMQVALVNDGPVTIWLDWPA
jgi:D-tyrosyl-tRNA(Tyr) deacylase